MVKAKVLCGALQSGLVMDILKGDYQDGLDTHIAVDNSWALIEARPSEVLDRAAAECCRVQATARSQSPGPAALLCWCQRRKSVGVTSSFD